MLHFRRRCWSAGGVGGGAAGADGDVTAAEDEWSDAYEAVPPPPKVDRSASDVPRIELGSEVAASQRTRRPGDSDAGSSSSHPASRGTIATGTNATKG